MKRAAKRLFKTTFLSKKGITWLIFLIATASSFAKVLLSKHAVPNSELMFYGLIIVALLVLSGLITFAEIKIEYKKD